jgi:hypothetical protein
MTTPMTIAALIGKAQNDVEASSDFSLFDPYSPTN